MHTPDWLETMYFYLLDIFFHLKDSPDFRYLENSFDIWNKESFIKRYEYMISLIASDILSPMSNFQMRWNEERQTIWLFSISESLLIHLSYILAELCLKTLCIFTQLTTTILDTANKNVLCQFGCMCS